MRSVAVATIRCGGATFKNIQAILFDKDGTLAQAEPFLRSLGQKRSRLIDAQVPGVQEPLLLAFGLEGERLNPGGLLAVGSRRENEIAAAAYIAETGRNWVEALQIAGAGFADADGFLPRKAEQTPPLPGVPELLQRLIPAGLKVGILSADTADNIQDFLQTYRLEASIHLVMGVEAGLSKPDPQLFHQACAALGITPENTLMVGDSTADIAMAEAAGAAGWIGFTGGWRQTPTFTAFEQAIAEGRGVVIDYLEQLQVSR